MKTLVILGEILMAKIWTDEGGNTYQIKPSTAFTHPLEANTYTTMYEAQGACKHLVPVPCREYIKFMDVKG